MVWQDKKTWDLTMPQGTEKTIKELTERLWALPIEEYLSSEKFFIFCRNHDLQDVWKENLDLSLDRPDLYGSAVIKKALVRFLHHIYHSRPDEFPALFTRLLVDFSRGVSCALPVDDLKMDLQLLGYSDLVIEKEFSRLNGDAKDTPEPREDRLS